MKKRLLTFSFLLLFIHVMTSAFLSNSIQVEASVSDMERLSDYADILTDSEEELLTSQLNTISEKNNIDVIVMTITSAGSYDLDYYVNNIYDTNNYSDDTVLLAINMDSFNREVLVQGQGKCQTYINNKRAQNITDSMVSDLKAQKYYKSILTYIDKVDYFYQHKKPIATPIQLLAEVAGALIAAGAIVLVMVLNAGGRNTTTCNTYLDTSSSKVLARRDIYTHTTTTRHKIESNNSHGGGHGGGGGGHSTGRSSF